MSTLAAKGDTILASAKSLGRVSAGQVIACFRHDFALKAHGLVWPENTGDPSKDFHLPAQRLVMVANARGSWALYFVLECTWTAYEVSADDILAFRAWTNNTGSKTVGQTIADYRRDPTSFGDEAALKRLADIRMTIRSGDFDMSVLLAATSDAARVPYPFAPSGSLCLIDGNHRLVALAEECRMPKTATVFVGDVPEGRFGMAVLNGRLPPGHKGGPATGYDGG